jgi:hypothetical protein
MTESVDPTELERRDRALRALVERDAEIGRRAEARVTARYGVSGSMDEYRFADSFIRDEQATQKLDWVHQGNLRPVRFVYRHLPKPIRFLIKRAVK